MSALLTLDLLTRRFGGIMAVDALSMQVEDGEIRGLIGPNGAGKTTTLDLISGLIPPTSGRMALEQTNVTGEPAHRLAKRGIRRTFQNLKLFAELTVLQNVMIGLHVQGTSGVLQAIMAPGKQRREEQMMVGESVAALETVGLAGQAGLPASALAYGHRRLLEIARAIVARPILLLLDEPAAGLNASETETLIGLIRRINAQGVTVLLVEHHMDVIMASCSRITVLNYGQKLAEGTPLEIRTNESVIAAYLGRPGFEERIASSYA
jgi:branched-chain amino acid transport system ATP-binding protein